MKEDETILMKFRLNAEMGLIFSFTHHHFYAIPGAQSNEWVEVDCLIFDYSEFVALYHHSQNELHFHEGKVVADT